MLGLVQQYKKYIIFIVLVVLVGAAAFVGYTTYQKKHNKQQVLLFESQVKVDGTIRKSARESILRKLVSKNNNKGIRFLGTIAYAQFLAKKNQRDKAASVLLTYATSNADSLYTAYARLAYIWMRLQDKNLSPLLVDIDNLVAEKMFVVPALLTKVEILLSMNQKQQAKDTLLIILYSNMANKTQKNIAKDLLQALQT